MSVDFYVCMYYSVNAHHMSSPGLLDYCGCYLLQGLLSGLLGTLVLRAGGILRNVKREKDEKMGRGQVQQNETMNNISSKVPCFYSSIICKHSPNHYLLLYTLA